jgi:hypothetical protein
MELAVDGAQAEILGTGSDPEERGGRGREE